ncbi:hypothetical protein [Bartonella sp. AS69XJJH]
MRVLGAVGVKRAPMEGLDCEMRWNRGRLGEKGSVCGMALKR